MCIWNSTDPVRLYPGASQNQRSQKWESQKVHRERSVKLVLTELAAPIGLAPNRDGRILFRVIRRK